MYMYVYIVSTCSTNYKYLTQELMILTMRSEVEEVLEITNQIKPQWCQ